MITQRAPYLQKISVVESRVPDFNTWPFSIPFVKGLELPFTSPVTFFVGENGSGKSTLIEAIAELCGLPVAGGGKNELAAHHGPESHSPLAPVLRPAFAARPRDSYFFRAEYQAHFATLLDQRRADPAFWGDPYQRYGGGSLHKRSHGEAFLDLLLNRVRVGLFLLDEPESALSPQRQLTLMSRLAELVMAGSVQLIVATHSPILLTFPGAEVISFEQGELKRVGFTETSHFQLTRGILEDPERYWRSLLKESEKPAG